VIRIRARGSPVQPPRSNLDLVDDSTEWRGHTDTSRRRLWKLLLVSALAHVPLTPLAALIGLLALIGEARELPPGESLPAINAIPVDLIEDEGTAEPTEPAPDKKPRALATASADDKEAPAKPRVELEPATEKGAKEKAEQDGEKPSGDRATGGIGDPVAMAGNAAKIANANANVRLFIFTDRIRNHPLGDQIGKLLADADQWKDFFGTGGLDPIRDVDRILIAGPQLRDSSEVVAVLRHNASPPKLRAALDALVKRDPQGSWVDGPIPVARARADRAERVFVIASPRILVVTPASAAENAVKQAPGLRFPEPKGTEALTTYLVTPWRAFIGVPFEVPKSIAWVRMRITPTSDGGASAELVAKDASAEQAQKNAKKLSDDINRVTQLSTGVVGKLFGIKSTFSVIQPVSFTAKGDEIHGTVVATPKQLGALLEAIANIAKDIARTNEQKAAAARAAAAADAGAGGASASDAGNAPIAPAPRADAAGD
jgi:hypothetical protein